MSDNLYNRLFESWEKLSTPQLITESEVREALPDIEQDQIENVRTICENYLKFEYIALSETEEVLERFAGDDKTIQPGFKYDPEAGKAAASVDAPAQEKKQGFIGKVKEFASKVKGIYKQLPKKKILILLAAGLVISLIAPHVPIVGGIAKVAFGGFNVFKGGKGFWSEFNKVKGDRSNVKAVLAVLQLALGIFSSIHGAGNIVDQIATTKQQVASAVTDAAPSTPTHAPTPPVEDPQAAPTHAPAAPATPNIDAGAQSLIDKIHSTAQTYAQNHYGELSNPQTQVGALSALKAKIDAMTSIGDTQKKLLARQILQALAEKGTYIPNGLHRLGFGGI